MKLATQRKNKPADQPSAQPPDEIITTLPGGQTDEATFLVTLVKQFGITRKELAYEMRVSTTTVDNWLAGLKPFALSRSRLFCDIARDRGCSHLVPAILTWIGGGFDGAVLDAAQAEALKSLTKAVR